MSSLAINDSWNETTVNYSSQPERPVDIVSYTSVQTIFYILYASIFLIGVFGNCLVCFVVLSNKHMQTVTNYFIMNLALADILLCIIGVPFTPLYFFMGEWIFGSVLCRLVSFSQGVSVYVSTLTLTSIAIDRYFVIIYPFRPRLKFCSCFFIIACIWVFSLSATAPYAYYIGQVSFGESHFCEEMWPSERIRRIFSVFTAIMQFVFPFVIILYCYVRISIRMNQRVRSKPGAKTSKKDEVERERKRRTNRMLIAMVTVFGISWLPMTVIHLIGDYYVNSSRWRLYNLFFFISHVVAMSSACYNPFLYAWLNENFRKEFQLVLPCFDEPPPMARGQWRSERTCNELESQRRHNNSFARGRGPRAGSLQITTLPPMDEESHKDPKVHEELDDLQKEDELPLTTFQNSTDENNKSLMLDSNA